MLIKYWFKCGTIFPYMNIRVVHVVVSHLKVRHIKFNCHLLPASLSLVASYISNRLFVLSYLECYTPSSSSNQYLSIFLRRTNSKFFIPFFGYFADNYHYHHDAGKFLFFCFLVAVSSDSESPIRRVRVIT